MEEEKKPLKYFCLKYTGKELLQSGTDKNGNEYKMFRLLFETDGQYPMKVTIFNDLPGKESVKVKELEEGNFYMVGYTETQKTHAQYGNITYRNAIFARVAEEKDRKLPETAKPKQDSGKFNLNNHVTKINEITKQYQELCKELNKEANLYHYIGFVVKEGNLIPELVDFLQPLYDLGIKKE